MTWASFPIAGGAYSDQTKPWSAQDTVNWLPVTAGFSGQQTPPLYQAAVGQAAGTRTPSMLRGVPGLNPTTPPYNTFGGANNLGVPIRGAYNADGVFVVVQAQSVYRFYGTFDGVTYPTRLGTLPGTDRVSITHNQITGGSQIVFANGVGGYVYNTVTGTFAQISDPGFPGAKSVDYIDSYIVAVEPQGRYWFTSALADATSYNTLDTYEAESAPDKIVCLATSHSEVVVFGERTIQFYYDSGALTTTFQNRTGTQIEIGIASPFALAKLDNSLFWLGNDGVVYRLDGYNPAAISTRPIEQAIAQCNIASAFMLSYQSEGHKIIYLTCPDGQTWGYDVTTQEWHRRASYGMANWRVNTLTEWNGAWYAGDFTNGAMYTVEWGLNTENGLPLVAERTSAVMQADQNRFRLNAVALEMDSQKSAPTNTFNSCTNMLIPVAWEPLDLPDVDFRVSKDGAHNWGEWRQAHLGLQGAFNNRLVFRRLGMGRRIVMQIRVSADRGRDLIAASVNSTPFEPSAQ